MDLTSVFKNVISVNGGANMVGINDLTGTTTISGATVKVEVLASVDYLNGSGPFAGSMTLTYPDGSLLTFRQPGFATFDSTTQITTLKSQMTVVGGTGTAANAKGSGSYVGTRSTVLGGPVHLVVQAYTHQ